MDEARMSTATRWRIGASSVSLIVALLAGLVPAAAHAQDLPVDPASQPPAADAPEQADEGESIVVTGTLIRGTAPVGANAITVDAARIQETGAVSSNELLASVPQVTSFFNTVPLAQIDSFTTGRVQTTRPNIRSLGNDTIAVSPTLVLVNGHRIAGVGVSNSNVDPDMIAIGAIDRVDVVTEGGTATYGADAVAGVINFVTRRRFDGLSIDGSYGFADAYSQHNVNVVGGHSWSTGSIFAAYSYSHTDSLFGRDRDYVQDLDYSVNPPVLQNLTCATPNLTLSTLLVQSIGGRILGSFGEVPYAAPGFTPNTANRCDNSQNTTLLPESDRHTVFAGLHQELGPNTTIDLRGFYGRRTTEAQSEATGVVALGSGNPAAAALPAGLVVGPTCIPGIGCSFLGFPFENRALVNFSFSPVLGPNPLSQTTLLEEWGADVELTHDFGADWQLRALAAYSESNSLFNAQSVNATRLDAAGRATTASTAINPFNLAQTSRALIDDLIDNETAGQSRDRLLQLRAILEGRLFSLPGGDVRLAIGAEYLDDQLRSRTGDQIRLGTLGDIAYGSIGRNVKSVFGELQVPLFSRDNAIPGLHSLVVSVAARYDEYSDFGGTFNPKIGVTYEPVAGFRIRGNWGTSFTAPSLVDLSGGLPGFTVGQSHPFQPAGTPPPAGSYDVIITGTRLPLQPQEADTWSVGVDLEPIDNLRLSLSYYSVRFTNIITPPYPGPEIFELFADTNFVSGTGLSADLVRSFASQVPGGLAQVEPLLAAGAPFYSLIDYRTGNYGILDVAGVDFSASYRRDTNFGSFDLAMSGNLALRRDEQVSPTAPTIDRLLTDDSPELLVQVSAGVDVGGFRAQATLNHSAGFSITPTNSVPPQTEVDAFNSVNLFFRYNVPVESGVLSNLSFRLNINNLFDQDPPEYRGDVINGRGYNANQFTLGRLIQFGVTKRF